ncbi:MAG: protein-tyrosine phosphatase family protein [Phycisphaerae bacterium]
MGDSRLPQKPKSRFRRTVFISVLAAVVLLIGGLLLWKYGLEDRFVPRRFGIVKQGHMYRSGQISSSLIKDVLVRYKIRTIVSLSADSVSNTDKAAEKQIAAELGIERKVFSLGGDGTGDINNYAKAIAAIYYAKKERKPVLIHCYAGVHRTGGVIAAYQLLVEKKDASSVVKEMMRYGWDPKDDVVLLSYLNINMKELATLLLQMGVIDSVPSPLPQMPVSS